MKALKFFLLAGIVSFSIDTSYAQDDGNGKKPKEFKQVRQRQQQQQQQARDPQREADMIEQSIDIKDKALKEAGDLLDIKTDSIFKLPVSNEEKLRLNEIILEEYNAAVADIEASFLTNLEIAYGRMNRESFVLFPSKHDFINMLYYNSQNQTDFFKQINVNYWGDNASFGTEVLTVYGGRIRWDISTVISKSQVKAIDPKSTVNMAEAQLDSVIAATDSVNKANSTLTKVVSGGGELSLNLRYPLFNLQIRDRNKQKFRFCSEAVVSGSLDLPAGTTYIDPKEIPIFASAGLRTDISVTLGNFKRKEKSRVYERYDALAIQIRHNVRGITGNDMFLSTLGQEKGFIMNDFSIGGAFKNFFLYYNFQLFDSDKLESKQRIGLAFIRSL